MQNHSWHNTRTHFLTSRLSAQSSRLRHLLQSLRLFPATCTKTLSPFSLKHAFRFSLVLLISASFVLQTNITKPLAETLDALGAPFAWDPNTKVLTIQGNCGTSDIMREIKNEASTAQEVRFSGDITITTNQYTASTFEDATNLERITALEGTHVSFAAASGEANPTINFLFKNCSNLNSIDGLATWDVSNVTGAKCMYHTFFGCTSLTSLDALAFWNVSNVAGSGCMGAMFYGCTNLQDITGIAQWSLANAKSVEGAVNQMFYGCPNITYIKGASTDAAGFVPTNASKTNMYIGTLVSSNNFYSEETTTIPVPGDTLLANWSTHAAQGTWTWKQTVTFDANGGQGAPASELIVHNSYATEPTPDQNPTKEGFIFDGWATDAAGSARFDFAHTKLTEDTTLYAQWNPLPVYSVTFNTAGGSLEETQYIEQGQSAARPSEDPTRVGYTFDNWYTDETGTTLFDFASPILADTVVYAHWTADPSPSDNIVPEDDVLLPQTGDGTSVLLPLLFLPAGIVLFTGYEVVKRLNS